MKRLIYAAAAASMVVAVLALVGCTPAGSGDTGTISISASAGTLTGSGVSWTFDAGTVPQYTTETITFTVTNTTSLDFLATGSQAFTSGEFTDSIGGAFDVAANSTNTFTGSFAPTGTPDSPETGTLTLTPTTGSPITVTLKVTPDASFMVMDVQTPFPTQITPTVQGTVYYNAGSNTLTITNNSPTATITLTGGPNYVAITGPGYSLSSQPGSATILPNGGTATFDIQNSISASGYIGDIKISGVDSTTNASFTFSGSVIDTGAP
jgi:hypothetical protein